jgi:hypothetical protein
VYWRTRKDLPSVDLRVTEEMRDDLADSISAMLKSEGRGQQCSVESFRRGSVTYFVVYPDDFIRSDQVHDDTGRMIKKIAWRLQADVEGDLPERVRLRALGMADDADLRVRPSRDFGKKVATADEQTSLPNLEDRDPRLPPPGETITKTYKSRTLTVLVRQNDFEFNGEVYKSLTAIANAVTTPSKQADADEQRISSLASLNEQCARNQKRLANQTEIARTVGVTTARVTQILNLTYLAPDIQRTILELEPTTDKRDPFLERDARTIATNLCWVRQRKEFARLITRYTI